MGQPVVHFEISGRDYKKSIEFYRSLFNWKIEEAGAFPYGMVQGEGDQAIGGGISPVAEGGSPGVTVYVMVDDLPAYLDRAVKLGAKTVMPPSPIPGIGEFAMFADPDGNVIGLFKGN